MTSMNPQVKPMIELLCTKSSEKGRVHYMYVRIISVCVLTAGT